MNLIKGSDKFFEDFRTQVSLKSENIFQNLANLYYLIKLDKNKSCDYSTQKIIAKMHQDLKQWFFKPGNILKNIRQLKRCLIIVREDKLIVSESKKKFP